jgi:molecular chaperone GrpE (heat shock protein)
LLYRLTVDQDDQQAQTQPTGDLTDQAEQPQQVANSAVTANKDWEQLYNQARSQLLQLMADFENHRKRTDSEKAKYSLLGNMMLVGQIMEIVDDIQLALNDQDLDLERARQMLEINRDKLLGGLQIAGVQKIEVQKGDKFDATMMEAVTSITGEASNSGTVADVISAGFKHGQTSEILKTAKVVVYK